MAKHPLLRNAVKAFRENPMVFVAVGFCLGAFWLFSEIADDVQEGDSAEIDRSLLLMLRNPADHTDPLGARWVEEMMRDLTALGGATVVVFISVATFFYLLVSRRRGHAFYLAASITTGYIFSSLSKYGFDRARPDLVPHGSYVYTSSFPSGHSLMSALAYLTLAMLLAEAHPQKGLKIFFMTVAALITMMTGFSRVYLGVHWPSDVLAGWLGGAAWALMSWLIWTRILHYHKTRKKPAAG
ncbi:MAG TPA: phosphatase PAP2 family protein [Patescibacteria group bacterium]|nr:phosphatase PAP2 family protein [Patescibacteria group bacterium]